MRHADQDANNMNVIESVQTVIAAAPVPGHIAEQVENRDIAKAVEVAAIFDDTVLAMRHYNQPQAGRASGLTKMVLGSAGAALFGVCALFGASYLEVVKEKQETAAPTKRAPKSPIRDIATTGLLLYGIGGLLYGVHRASGERKENEFSIGSDAQATFPCDAQALPLVKFPLLRSTGTGYQVLFSDGMQGELRVSGQHTALSGLREQGVARPLADIPGAYALTLPQGGTLHLRHAQVEFMLRSVVSPRHMPAPLRVDWRAQGYTMGVLAGASLMLGLMFATPPDPKSLALDAFSNQALVAILVKAEEPKQDETPWLATQPKSEPTRSGGQASKGPSGKSRSPEMITSKDVHIMSKPGKSDPSLSREAAREVASTTGILQVLHSSNAFAGLRTAAVFGNDAKEALDGVAADVCGEGAACNPGMGLVGVGPGADGTGERTIGLGNFPTGNGPGNGPGKGGYRGPRLKEHIAAAPPQWTLGPPEVVGSLDREVIRRVIRGHMNEVKFCYEKELAHDASLSGRVVVKFTIASNGKVAASAVGDSTLPSLAAASCIARAVGRWEFPQPHGGIVGVSYPFVLKHAN